MDEKISVIIPVYKVEQYLEKCVDSILNQTYRNIEVILVDDGSPDNCGKICDMYAQKDNRVRVHHKVNEGISEARNVGVQLASGDYITFIDSDDYVEPDMLEILYMRMKQEGSDLAICNFLYVDEQGGMIEERNENMPIVDEVLTGREAFARLGGDKYWYYVTVWNRLYSRGLLKEIRFPKGKALQEDELIAHHILDKCKKVSCIEKPLYFYVQRKQSAMNSGYTVKNLDGIESFCDRVMFASTKNVRVTDFSLVKAGNLLLKAYRELGEQEENRSKLKEKRIMYNRAYMAAFKTRISFKTRMRCGLIFLHPNIYIKLAKVLLKNN